MVVIYGSQKQMIGTNTVWNVTFMTNKHTIGERSGKMLIGPPMYRDFPSANNKLWISFHGFRAYPYPAFVALISFDLLVEPYFWRRDAVFCSTARRAKSTSIAYFIRIGKKFLAAEQGRHLFQRVSSILSRSVTSALLRAIFTSAVSYSSWFGLEWAITILAGNNHDHSVMVVSVRLDCGSRYGAPGFGCTSLAAFRP